MFEALKRFIADVSTQANNTSRGGGFEPDDYRLATAALLVHVANVDGKIDQAERSRLRDVIEKQFGLNVADTTRLIEKAEESDREAVDFFHFTNVLKHSLDDAGRHHIIEMMWDVVFADGEVSEFEENVVWRISELLGVPNRDRVALRQKVAEEEHVTAEHSGPWGGGSSKI